MSYYQGLECWQGLFGLAYGLELHVLGFGLNLAGLPGVDSTLNSRMAKKTNSCARLSGFKSQLCHFLPADVTLDMLPNIFMPYYLHLENENNNDRTYFIIGLL